MIVKRERSILIAIIVFGIISINSVLEFVGCTKSDIIAKPHDKAFETTIIEKHIKQICFVVQWINVWTRGILLRDFYS